jgi:hypothetical protein
MSPSYKILAALPTYGPDPIRFSDTGMGMHSEGFVVEFFPGEDRAWVGNFHRGLSSFDAATAHPNGYLVIVVAGGSAYFVDPEKRDVEQTFGGDIVYLEDAKDIQAVVLGDPCGLHAQYPDSRISTPRISWDGMRNLERDVEAISGEAWDPMQNAWLPFRADLRSGEVEGGSYINE